VLGRPPLVALLRSPLKSLQEQAAATVRNLTADDAIKARLVQEGGLGPLVQLLDVPEFRSAWLEYCRLYNADAAEQSARLGRAMRGRNLEQGHARLTAFAAKGLADPALAIRAWQEFRRGENGWRSRDPLVLRRIEGSAVPRPVDEAVGFSTNAAAQWGLAAIQCLALLGEPPELGAETDVQRPREGGGR
jgi:hypothetical protein